MLSYLTLKNSATPSANIAVLNSVVNLDKAKDFLCKHQTLHCFMDNDEAGRKAQSTMESWDVKTVDHSKMYSNYNDVNDYLQGAKQNSIMKPKQRLKLR